MLHHGRPVVEEVRSRGERSTLTVSVAEEVEINDFRCSIDNIALSGSMLHHGRPVRGPAGGGASAPRPDRPDATVRPETSPFLQRLGSDVRRLGADDNSTPKPRTWTELCCDTTKPTTHTKAR